MVPTRSPETIPTNYTRPLDVNSASLSWEKPTTNEDGSPMTDLARYEIYYSQTTPATTYNSQLASVLNPNQTSYLVADLAPGTYYFTVTAVNLVGNESDLSNEVTGYVNWRRKHEKVDCMDCCWKSCVGGWYPQKLLREWVSSISSTHYTGSNPWSVRSVFRCRVR